MEKPTLPISRALLVIPCPVENAPVTHHVLHPARNLWHALWLIRREREEHRAHERTQVARQQEEAPSCCNADERQRTERKRGANRPPQRKGLLPSGARIDGVAAPLGGRRHQRLDEHPTVPPISSPASVPLMSRSCRWWRRWSSCKLGDVAWRGVAAAANAVPTTTANKLKPR